MKAKRDVNVKKYRLNWKENLLWLFVALGFAGMISWLFYRSMYGMVSLVPLLMITRKFFRSYLSRRQKREMLYQFGEILQITSSSLKAGYAIENAFVQAYDEYVKLYGSKSIMAQEFCRIIYRMEFNEPLEKLVEDLARRSQIEEIISFSQVLSFAKRGGGDMRKILQNTAEKIRQKADVEREIVTVVTAKKTEQRIMDIVPFAILIYVGASAPEFLAPLYGNILGVCVMTLCLLAYAGAFLLAEKILDIQV